MHRAFACLSIASLIAVAACSDDGGDDQGTGEVDRDRAGEEAAASVEPPGWEVIDDASVQPRSLEDSPLWGSESGGPMPSVSRAEFREDKAILEGDVGFNGGPLAVVEAETGEELWSLQEGDDLPGGEGVTWDSGYRFTIVDQDDGWAVLVVYDDDIGAGLAALSAETGEVLWRRDVIAAGSSTEDSEELVLYKVGADAATAVVLIGPLIEEEKNDTLKAVAVDTSDGAVLWEEPGLDGVPWRSQPRVVGDTVLSSVTFESGEPEEIPGQAVLALDAATGEPRWDLSDRSVASKVLLTAGDLAVVQVAEETTESPDGLMVETAETLVVDVGTGDEIASYGTTIGWEEPTRCDSDGEVLIACTVSDEEGDKLATLRIDDRVARVSAQEIPNLVVSVDQERVRVGSVGGMVLDPAGDIIDEEPLGSFVAVSDQHAIVLEGSDDGGETPGYAVYGLAE